MANRNVTQAVKLALISAGAVTAGLYGVVGSAQEQLSEIVVTGSRIARPDLEGVSPITVVSGATILETGFTDVGDLLQNIPSMSGSPIGTTTNNGGNGGVFIDLRGMQPDRTVTLVNGKRSVDAGDFQTIPANIIERVEILKGGASAVYGADAVAGVVNVITRTSFDGIEISAQRADWDKTKAGAQDSVSVFGGHSFDNGGHFVFGAEFVDQEAAFQRDAPWEFFQNSYYVYPQGCESHMFLPYDGTPEGGCYAGGSSRIPEASLRFATQGRFMNDGSGLATYDGRLYNYAPVNYIQTPYKRTNLYLDGAFPLTDTVEFNASMRINYRQSEQLLAPNPYDSRSGFDPGYQGTWDNPATPEDDTISYNGISPDNYYLRRAVDAYNVLNPGATLAYQPVTDARRRFVEIPRSFTQDVLQFQTNVGLNGSLPNDVKWDVYYNFGYRSRTDHDYGQFAGVELGNAMGPSADLNGDGVPECYQDISNPSTLIAGCVPMDFFSGPGAVTQDMLGYVGANLTDTFLTKQHEAAITFTGDWFDMPGGKLGWALGYTYTRNSFAYAPDSMKQKGTVTGNKGNPTEGSLEDNSLYGELLAPFYDNGDQSLTANASVRYDKYDAFDAETTYTLGLDFNVYRDLKLRAAYSTVFRAPTITDLYGGIADNFPTYNDPCLPQAGVIAPGCAQAAPPGEFQVRTREGGNPDLQPETGDTWSVGLVWTPEIGPGNFSATFDYWSIALEDAISTVGVQRILDECYISQNPDFCVLITRRSDYTIDNVINGSLNVAEQGAKGYDTELRYSWETSIGRWEASVLWAHMLERTKTPYPGAAEIDLSGRYSDPTAEDGGSYAADKVNYSLKWYWNDLLIGYQGEYISSLDADVTFFPREEYTQKIDSQLYHDIVASYEFGQGTKVSGGVSNITNEAPPWLDYGFNAKTDPSTYRMFGRGYYLRLTHTFK